MYEGRFDANVFWREYYSFTEGEKEKNVSSAWYSFQIYELYFYKYRPCIIVNLEREGSKQAFRNKQQIRVLERFL